MPKAPLAVTIDLQPHIEACLDYEKTNGLKERSLKSIRSYLNNFADYLELHPVDELNSFTPDYLRAFIIDRTEDQVGKIRQDNALPFKVVEIQTDGFETQGIVLFNTSCSLCS